MVQWVLTLLIADIIVIVCSIKTLRIAAQDFTAAAEKVKALTKRPTDQELLEVYALFKQGSVGDNNTSMITHFSSNHSNKM